MSKSPNLIQVHTQSQPIHTHQQKPRNRITPMLESGYRFLACKLWIWHKKNGNRIQNFQIGGEFWPDNFNNEITETK